MTIAILGPKPGSAKGIVLGIDVGFSATRRTTGFCALWWNDNSINWLCENASMLEGHRREVLRRVLNGHASVDGAAIDGPLRPRLSLGTTYRACESLLSRGLFQRRGKPGASNSSVGRLLHEAATTLATFTLQEIRVAPSRRIACIGPHFIVEAFPSLFLGVLCDDIEYPTDTRKWTDVLYRDKKVRDKLEGLLTHLLPQRVISGRWPVSDHEEIASLVCALTALCAVRRRLVAVGAKQDGYMILPPLRFWGECRTAQSAWAWLQLAENLKAVRHQFPDARIWARPVSKRMLSLLP